MANRPTPTAIRIATGNPSGRKLNKKEPTPEGIPIPPDHLSDGARKAWFTIVPILCSMRVATSADYMAIARLCECYALVNDLEKNIREKGTTQVVVTESGAEFERPRPQVSMLADADRRLKGYLVEYGLTSAARSKVSVTENQNQPDEFFNGA